VQTYHNGATTQSEWQHAHIIGYLDNIKLPAICLQGQPSSQTKTRYEIAQIPDLAFEQSNYADTFIRFFPVGLAETDDRDLVTFLKQAVGNGMYKRPDTAVGSRGILVADKNNLHQSIGSFNP
jgi:hypothetical protein